MVRRLGQSEDERVYEVKKSLYTTSMCENIHWGFLNELLFIPRFISVIFQLCLTIELDNKRKLNVFLLLFYRGFNLNQALQQY